MFANSRPVQSIQTTVHPRLREVVRRHLQSPYRRRPSVAGQAAFASVFERLQRPFILDAGCGTGASTLALAREYPQQLVLGVDKSAARLAIGQRLIEAGEAPANALLLRCELVDFWQLAVSAGLRCERQYLLYPNPWPKPDHLKRRWYAHPVWRDVLMLGGTMEVRTNWRIYAEEFAVALRLGGCDSSLVRFTPIAAISPFECKYAASQHELWHCKSDHVGHAAAD